MRKISVIAGTVLATALGAQAALAGSEGWVFSEDSKGARPGVSVYANDPKGGGLYLKCSEDSISASFMVKPGDFDDVIGGNTNRFRKRNVTVTFKDGSTGETESLYLPSFATAMVGDRRFVAKVFTSALRGEDLSVKVDRVDETKITLPPKDEAFQKFVDGCPLIN